ncbi:MAG TPA: SRPBCC family protein [Solimonas sp.]|nr:SRPBCC family protein [Solimonas sp.]
MSQEVRFQATVQAPRERVFAFLADHQKFARLFGGTCERVKDGQGDVNGLGSVRRMGPGPLAFEETIVTFEPASRIEYTVTRGSPIRNHLGTVDLRDAGGATAIDYVIRFEPKIPGTGGLIAAALRTALKLNARKALATLEG